MSPTVPITQAAGHRQDRLWAEPTGDRCREENSVTGPQSHELRLDIPNESAQMRRRPREPQPGAFSFPVRFPGGFAG